MNKTFYEEIKLSIQAVHSSGISNKIVDKESRLKTIQVT